MKIKTCSAKVKAADTGEGSGEFEALVSVFGNTDAVGDIVQKGAFAKSLQRWEDSGDPIPVIWSHDHSNPDAHIGVTTEAKESDDGLLVKGILDVDEPFAAKVYRLMKARRVTKFSFAYDIKEYDPNKDGTISLKELDLWEVGPTLIPANDATNLLDVKNLMINEGVDLMELAAVIRGLKAGRVLSSKNEQVLIGVAEMLSEAQSKINSVLESVIGPDDDAQDEKPAEETTDPAKSKSAKLEETKLESPSKLVTYSSAESYKSLIDLLSNEADLMEES